jgi:two-component system nitrate/nitrite response regulator NarL
LIERELSDESGVEVTRRLRRMGQRLRIVVLSVRQDVDTALEALMAGANGYLTKDAGFDRLPRTMAATLAGEAVISRKLVGRVLDRLREQSEDAEATEPSFARLTPREWEVLDLLCRRRTTAEIAATLGISPETVRTHVKHVLHKTGSSNRREVVEARRSWDAGAGRGSSGMVRPSGRHLPPSRIE